jgi:Protein of unknown function (DUF4240)
VRDERQRPARRDLSLAACGQRPRSRSAGLDRSGRHRAVAPRRRRLLAPRRRDRAAAEDDTARQTSLLETRLRHLPPSQIAEFESIRHRLDERAYTWNLWGAAYVIEDGCSDDCFRDFRAYLISLGQGPYAKALANPDSLARVVQDAETGDWENADDVAGDAYQAVTGEDIPTGDSDVSGSPRGTPWDDEQVDELVQRYPALAARFR